MLGGRIRGGGEIHQTCLFQRFLPFAILSFPLRTICTQGCVFPSLASLLPGVVQSIGLTSWNMFGCGPSSYFADEIRGVSGSFLSDLLSEFVPSRKLCEAAYGPLT